MKKKTMTIHDLAELAGVSVATVSRSLNGSSLVREKTKQRILDLAADMRFEINASAKGLATSKVDTIGVILPSEYDKFGPQQYYASLMDDLRDSLERSNYDLIVSFANNRITNKSNILRLVDRHKVDGLIILRENIDQSVLDWLEKENVPYVFSHHPPKSDGFIYDAIFTDHVWGGKLAGEHLAALGCRKILCISLDVKTRQFEQRESGFCKSLTDKGIDFGAENILRCPWTIEDGYKVIKENASQFLQADGLFSVTDLLAFGAMQALKELKIRIPQDISVIGYDDIPLSSSLRPKLTTIHQPREKIAQQTCLRLIEKIQKKEPVLGKFNLAIRPRLVIRESSHER